MALDLEPEVLSWRTAAVACAAAAAAAGWLLIAERRRPAPPPPPPIRLALAAPQAVTFGADDEALDAVVDPSNDRVVLVATSGGGSQLWLRALATDTATPIAGTEAARWPAWIPNEPAVSFFAGDTLKRVRFDATPPVTIARVTKPAGASWRPDGSVLVGHEAGAIDVWRAGAWTPATVLAPGDAAHRFPESVDADAWLYLAERVDGRRIVRIVHKGVTRDVTDADGQARVVGGWLLYPRGGALLAQRYVSQTGTFDGRPVALQVPVGVSSLGRARLAASDRVLLFAPPGGRSYVVRWFGPDGSAQESVSEPGHYWQVRLSPDDTAAAVTMPEPLLRTLDVYVLSKGSATPVAVSLGLDADTDPVWSPDGTTILFRSRRAGQSVLTTRRVGVVGAPEPQVPPAPLPAAVGVPSDWNERGDGVLFSRNAANAGTDVLRLHPTTGASAPVATGGFAESDGRFSPNSALVAYVSDESGQPEVYVVDVASGQRARVTHDGGSKPRWAGASIYFLRGDGEIWRADRLGTSPLRFGVPTVVLSAPGLRDFDTAHRRQALLAIVPHTVGRTPSIGALVEWRSLLPPR